MIAGIIEFSDPTMIEGGGNYDLIKEIMDKESPPQWMLRTNATIITESIISNFTLHLWNDGKAVIVDTDHPMMTEASDDDFRRLYEWSNNNGWKLIVDKYLLDNKQFLEFWMRLYRAGIVHSDILQKREEDEMRRMQDAYERDQKEEDEEETNYAN